MRPQRIEVLHHRRLEDAAVAISLEADRHGFSGRQFEPRGCVPAVIPGIQKLRIDGVLEHRRIVEVQIGVEAVMHQLVGLAYADRLERRLQRHELVEEPGRLFRSDPSERSVGFGDVEAAQRRVRPARELFQHARPEAGNGGRFINAVNVIDAVVHRPTTRIKSMTIQKRQPASKGNMQDSLAIRRSAP